MEVSHRVVVIDTNAYSYFKLGLHDVAKKLSLADVVIIPIIVDAELKAGFRNGKREKQNIEEYQQFQRDANAKIITISNETVDNYVHLYSLLKVNGTPIPTNDLWISSIAMEHGAPIITFDKHFLKVPGLRLVGI